MHTQVLRKHSVEERAILDSSLAENRRQYLDIAARINAGLGMIRLPDDILLEIFKFHLARWNLKPFDIPYEVAELVRKDSEALGWLPVTQICRRWRQAALSAPALWTTIRVSKLNCVETFLQRSRGMPLTVEGDLYADQGLKRSTIELWETVFAESYRIQDLKLRYSQISTPARFITRLAFDFPEFPVLKHVLLKVDSYNQAVFPPMLKKLQGHPALEAVVLHELDLPSAVPLFSPTLRTLVLFRSDYDGDNEPHVRWRTLLTSLKYLPNLEELRLIASLPAILPTGSPSELILGEQVQLPRLRKLQIIATASLGSVTTAVHNISVAPTCELLLSLGCMDNTRVGSHLIPFGQLLSEKVIGAANAVPPKPLRSLLLDTAKGTAGMLTSLLVGSTDICPILLQPSQSIFPVDLISGPFSFQLCIWRFSIEQILDFIVAHIPLRSVERLSLGSISIADLGYVWRPELPDLACLLRVYQEAENVEMLTIHRNMASMLPDILRCPANTQTLLFPKLKELRLCEVSFLETAPWRPRLLRRGAWWDAFTDALLARERIDPSLRLKKILLDHSESITEAEVKLLEKYADEVVWDGSLGRAVIDPDSEIDSDKEDERTYRLKYCASVEMGLTVLGKRY